jgi:hypothetical protein
VETLHWHDLIEPLGQGIDLAGHGHWLVGQVRLSDR